MRSRRLLVSLLTVVGSLAVVVGGLCPVAAQPPQMTVLGTDVSLDAPPGADLTEFAVARRGDQLHVRFTFANSIPGIGTYGPPAGAGWLFEVNYRTFRVDGFQQGTGFRFVLFEKLNGINYLRHDLKGSFDTIAGTMDIFVPLRSINAKPGDRIAGAGENDVEVHIEAGVDIIYPDTLTTTKAFVVPR